MPHAYVWTDWTNDDYERQRDAWHDNVLRPTRAGDLALVRKLAAKGLIPPVADVSHVDAEWRSDESDWDSDYDRYAGSYARQCIELVYNSIYTYTDEDGHDMPVTCYVELVWDLSDGSVRSVNFQYCIP